MFDEKEIMSVKFDKEGTMLAVGLSNGYIYLYNPYSSNIIRKFESSMEGEAITSIRFCPLKVSQMFIAASCDGIVNQFKISGGKKSEICREQDESGSNIQVFALDYHVQGLSFAAGRSDGSVIVYDDETKKIIQNYSHATGAHAGHSNRVFSVKFLTDDQNLLISGGWDGNMFIWDLRERKAVDFFKCEKISGDAIDYRGGNVLVGCHESNDPMTLWNLGQREKICGIKWVEGQEANDAFVYSCGFAKGGEDFIYAASVGRNELQLFEKDIVYKPSWTITGLKQGLYTSDISPKCDMIAFGGADNHLYIIDIGKII